MDREKQIAELTKDIYSMVRVDSMSRAMASVLYDKGYRKQTEAVKEVTERIKKELSFGYYIRADEIDKIVKEMVGETNG